MGKANVSSQKEKQPGQNARNTNKSAVGRITTVLDRKVVRVSDPYEPSALKRLFEIQLQRPRVLEICHF